MCVKDRALVCPKKQNLGQEQVFTSWAALGVQGERRHNVPVTLLADVGSLGQRYLQH